MLQCKNCWRIFSSGINLGSGSTVILKGNKSQCPYCGSLENIPDGTFRGTVEGIVQILEKAENPIKKAKELLDELENIKNEKDLTKVKSSSKFKDFKKWLPDSPAKILIYISILQILINLLTKNHRIQIKYNIFVAQYNQIINFNLNK